MVEREHHRVGREQFEVGLLHARHRPRGQEAQQPVARDERHQQFGVDWGDPVLFDLVLNTDRLSVDTCVQQIKALLQRPEFAETEASRALLRSMALHAHVRAALRAHTETQHVDITIEGSGPLVVLRGIVLQSAERQAAEQVAAAVTGVSGVDNQLRVMTSSRLFGATKN